MTEFALGDVRITTRVRENDLGEALFSTVHEAGHALYEQHIDPELDGTPLGQGRLGAACTRASRASGRTSSGAGRSSGPGPTRDFKRPFPGPARRRVSLDTLLPRHQQGRRARSSAPMPTRSLTTCTSSCASTSSSRCSKASWRWPICPRPGASGCRADLGVAPAGPTRTACLQDVHWFGGLDRRRVPGLHARQRDERAVLPSRAECAPGHPGPDRARPVRSPPELAHPKCLSSRAHA